MWTKVRFKKNSELSNGGVVFGLVTAVWNESMADEFIYSEELDIEADLRGFVDRAKLSLAKKNSDKTKIEETKVDEEALEVGILSELNKK